MRLIYTVLLYLLTPFVLLRLLFKSRRLPDYRRRVAERFGYVPAPVGGVAVWVHAVSVGEVLAALPLIEALLAQHGERGVWVTTTTPTGSARVRAAFGARVWHSYLPYDLPSALSRFLRRVQPGRLVIMETELWPNLFAACAARGVPLVVANARLSQRSFRRYMRIRGFVAATLAACSRIAAQSKADARRFKTLGASPNRVETMGNLKFEVSLPGEQIQAGRQLRQRLGAERPVWIAASTHEGEELAALHAHQAVLDVLPEAVLILVPRHPQRFDEIWSLLRDSGLSAERRSRLQALDRLSAGTQGDDEAVHDVRDTQVLLGDSMGEMYYYLAAADLAFVGGSLARVGGHNVLEPAALGLPVLFGPHMSNFAAARGLLLRLGAAEEVEDAADLAGEVASLLADPARSAQMGRAGEAAVAGNRGALARLLATLECFPPKQWPLNQVDPVNSADSSKR